VARPGCDLRGWPLPPAHRAGKLHDGLKARGHTFIDTAKIAHQIDCCDFFIILLSESSAQSEMVQAEVRLAHQARRTDGRPVIIPIRHPGRASPVSSSAAIMAAIRPPK
jgi:hypothetical protein